MIHDVCLSRIYVGKYFNHLAESKYITAHSQNFAPHFALPKGIREEVAQKVSKGIPAERILGKVFSIGKLYTMHNISDARVNVGRCTKWQDFF